MCIRDSDINVPNQIIYTSGTTGKPKGVLLTTRSMLWVVASCWVPIVNLNSKDKVLSPLPLFHSYAINFSILGIIASGCSEFILEKFSPSIVLDLLNSKDFTVLPGVPTMFHYLLETAKQNKISNCCWPTFACLVLAMSTRTGPLCPDNLSDSRS